MGGIQYPVSESKLKSLRHVTHPLTLSEKHVRHDESHFTQYDTRLLDTAVNGY